MKAFTILATAGVAALSSGAALADDWATSAGTDPAFKASAAICRAADERPLPKPEGATAPAGAPPCNSFELLAGGADPTAVKRCAFREMAAGENTVGGAATLATIYANGTGVARDYNTAIAYACRIDGAPFEMDGRIKHLARLKADGPGKTPFDLCDDITSGMMQGFCAERAGDLADAKRRKVIAQLTGGLSGPRRVAFQRLQKAEDAFVKASAEGEVDVSGTGRGEFIEQSEQKHRDSFLAMLRTVLADRAPADTPHAAGAEDRQLNLAYGKLMALKDTSGLGTVTKNGIRDAQRAWLGYRDAFVAFAEAGPTPGPVESLVAQLTHARVDDLRALLGS